MSDTPPRGPSPPPIPEVAAAPADVTSISEAATLAPANPAFADFPPPPAASSGSGGSRVPATGVPGYEFLGELGRGGMGVVYKARQVGLKRVVALKMILAGEHASPESLERFHVEAEAVARLQHPNIVQVYEVGEHGGLPYFSLEFCPGGGLDKKLGGGPLTPAEAANVVQVLARAMQAAHDAGVVHRDLKPANVLLDAAGVPKVSDFGLAKRLGEAGATASGALLGTPSYMAPEQAEGKSREIGPAADVYALGAILYECLTGRPPFHAETTMDTLVQVLADDPVPPRTVNRAVPRDLQTICLKCLEKDPKRRYASAGALADDLRAHLAGEPITARPPGIAGRVARWARLRPALAATLTALTAFYLNYLLIVGLGYANDGGEFLRFATFLTLAWAAGAVGCQWAVSRTRWRETATYGWSALDTLMLTLLLARGDGPRSYLLPGYLVLIGGTALRFRPGLLWFVTALSVASYLGLVADAAWRRPGMEVTPDAAMIFSVCLVLLGVIQHLLLRRIRAASTGPQPVPAARPGHPPP